MILQLNLRYSTRFGTEVTISTLKQAFTIMSFETMRKGLGSTIVSSIPMDIFYGVKFANYKRARIEILLSMMYGRNNGGKNGQYITAR